MWTAIGSLVGFCVYGTELWNLLGGEEEFLASWAIRTSQ